MVALFLWLFYFQVSLHFAVAIVAPNSVPVSSGQRDCQFPIKFQPSSAAPNTVFSRGDSHNKWETRSILFLSSSSYYSSKMNLFGSLSGPFRWVSPQLISFLEFVIVLCGRRKLQKLTQLYPVNAYTHGIFKARRVLFSCLGKTFPWVFAWFAPLLISVFAQMLIIQRRLL